MISWMQSLSDLTRTRLLRVLDHAEMTVAELCAVLQLPQSTISRHLRTLHDDGWLSVRRDGTSNFYSLNTLKDSRLRLWELVREQTASDTLSQQDDERLRQVLLERTDSTQSFFSSAASRWDSLREELFGNRIDAWMLSGLLPSDWVVADMGCGTGHLVQLMASHVREVIGVDSSTEMLKTARARVGNRKNVVFKNADLYRLPIADQYVDATMSSIILPYLEQPESAFREAARITKRGGRLVLVDLLPHDRYEYRLELNHLWFGFSTEAVTQILNDSGWRVDRCEKLPSQKEATGPKLFIGVATRI